MFSGLGLNPEHHDAALACVTEGMWFEVHAENCLVPGGPRLRWLEAIRAVHPLSLHSVSLSLAGDAPLDAAHLKRLSAPVRRVEPARFRCLGLPRWFSCRQRDGNSFRRSLGRSCVGRVRADRLRAARFWTPALKATRSQRPQALR